MAPFSPSAPSAPFAPGAPWGPVKSTGSGLGRFPSLVKVNTPAADRLGVKVTPSAPAAPVAPVGPWGPRMETAAGFCKPWSLVQDRMPSAERLGVKVAPFSPSAPSVPGVPWGPGGPCRMPPDRASSNSWESSSARAMAALAASVAACISSNRDSPVSGVRTRSSWLTRPSAWAASRSASLANTCTRMVWSSWVCMGFIVSPPM